MLVRTDIDQSLGVTVVGAVHHDNVLPSGIGAGQAQRQLIGFAAGTDKIANLQWLREFCQQTTGIFDNGVVQIARIGVEHRHLKLSRPDDMGMTVTHMAHIVDTIQICRPSSV